VFVDMRPDVIVIGGGIAGCATALELARAGMAVTVVESQRSVMPMMDAEMSRPLASVSMLRASCAR
jgi:2-polyprenyl-6-methoxyphenol hydroxylase-like FAD-dependent oxidoreductase